MIDYLSRPTRYLHWIIAILMIVIFIMGERMEDLEGAEKRELARLHASLGMTIFVLGLIRLINRLREGFPTPLGHQAQILETISKIIHWILLLIPVLLPISGVMIFYASGSGLSWFGFEFFAGTGEKNGTLSSTAKEMHEIGAKVFFLAFWLHVLGAVKHLVMDRDGTFQRMLGFGLK